MSERKHITELPEGEMYVTPLYVGGEGETLPRTLEQAMAHAESWRDTPAVRGGEYVELLYDQTVAALSDLVLLADEIKRLRKHLFEHHGCNSTIATLEEREAALLRVIKASFN